jgi:hypothetical protein
MACSAPDENSNRERLKPLRIPSALKERARNPAVDEEQERQAGYHGRTLGSS